MSGASQRDIVQYNGKTVVLIDSITQVEAGDTGRIVISGSHGGTSAASFAADVPAALYVFNDAGIGKDRAGVAGLDVLEAQWAAARPLSAQEEALTVHVDTTRPVDWAQLIPDTAARWS